MAAPRDTSLVNKPTTRGFPSADETMESEVNKTIAAFVLVLLAPSPTFTASPSAWQLHVEAPPLAFPYSGSSADTSREGLIRAFYGLR
jgi:hypothetical protein